MSDEPLDPRDALASDLLDGTVNPGADLDDAEVAGRVAALRTARAAVRAPVAPAPDAAREAAIAAALDALDPVAARSTTSDPGGDRAGAPALAPVTPLRWAARNPRWLGAAAAVAALALGVAVVLGGTTRNGHEDDTAAGAVLDEASPDAGTFDAQDGAATEQAPAALGEDHADLDAPATTALRTALTDLGSHPDLDALAVLVLATLDGDGPPEHSARTDAEIALAADPCEAAVTGVTGEGVLELEGTAVLAGDAVRAVVVRSPDDQRTLFVLAVTEPGCPVLDRRLLP